MDNNCHLNRFTLPQMMRGVDMRIATNGYTAQGVLPDDDNLGWTYTIGLAKSYGLPELVIVHDDNHLAADVLSDVVADLLEGNDIDDIPRSEFVPVDVHLHHLEGDLMNVWRTHYQEEPSTVRVVQLLFGPSYICDCCDHNQPDLSQSGATTARRKPNRAQRRARRRRAS